MEIQAQSFMLRRMETMELNTMSNLKELVCMR